MDHDAGSRDVGRGQRRAGGVTSLRVVAGPGCSQRVAAAVTISPIPRPSNRPPQARNRAGRGARFGRRQAGCGRLPHRHGRHEPSHRFRNRDANPLPSRALLTTGNGEFTNEFSAAGTILTNEPPPRWQPVSHANEMTGASAHRRPIMGNDRELRDDQRC